MREPEAGRTIPVSAGPAYWRAATTDGSMVFYTEGENLCRFNVKSSRREEAEPKPLRKRVNRSRAATRACSGRWDLNENGSYAYFVATEVLAQRKWNKEAAHMGNVNLYEWHEGKTILSRS